MAEKALTAVIQESHVQDVSTRSVDDLVKAMSGCGVSKSQVSRLCEEIDECVKAFLDRPLKGDWPCVSLAATYVKVRRNHHIISVAVIVAMFESDVRLLKGMDRKEPASKITKALKRTEGAARQKTMSLGASVRMMRERRMPARNR
jgi:hypothetical protein